MTKSLGQVAYEALVVGYGENVDAKEWQGLSQDTHEAWQAAAEKVAVKVLREQPNVIIADHELHPDAKRAIMETTRKHNAVIEAAKAFYVERQEPDSGHSREELTFWNAVRALLAAEGEE